MHNCPFEAVVFDAVGTIIFADPSPVEVYYRVGKSYGWQGALDQVRERLPLAVQAQFRSQSNSDLLPVCDVAQSSELPSFLNQDLEHRLRWRSVVAAVFCELEPDAVQRVFLQLWQYFSKPSSWRAFDDIESAWQWCRARDCTIIIASNFDSRLHNVIEGHRILSLAAHVVTSAQIGFAKPEKGFYEAVAQAANIPANRILMVGDDLQADFHGALAAGSASVWLNRSESHISQRREISNLRMLPDWIDRFGACEPLIEVEP